MIAYLCPSQCHTQSLMFYVRDVLTGAPECGMGRPRVTRPQKAALMMSALLWAQCLFAGAQEGRRGPASPSLHRRSAFISQLLAWTLQGHHVLSVAERQPTKCAVRHAPPAQNTVASNY
mmetsp:Transcript_51096/g.119630  ORF Transcript_51096/g.119630 Transcript_51096/m.119630 type:complete len:119 (+) Transcript_51096:1390-1746(+)